MPSCCAITLLGKPVTARSSTSRSRPVNESSDAAYRLPSLAALRAAASQASASLMLSSNSCSRYGLVIVDDEHRRNDGHQPVSSAHGSVNLNTAPPSGAGQAHKRPPCAPTIVRQSDSPIPRPELFVEKNGSKIRSASAAANPGPLS